MDQSYRGVCGSHVSVFPLCFTTLSHHTFFTTKLIPKLDKLIDDKNMGKMRTMREDLSSTVFSDGWTVVNHHPIGGDEDCLQDKYPQPPQ